MGDWDGSDSNAQWESGDAGAPRGPGDAGLVANTGVQFEWHEAKAELNRQTHGVTFVQAHSIFADPLAITIPDPLHSEDEDRFTTMGRSSTGDLLVVVHTERDGRIRLISARRATPKERRKYEQG